jgi:transcriptional regulator with XRE-family HTH domain
VINVRDKRFLKALGEHIKAIRSKKNMSQEDLANDADIPISQIGRVERGEVNTTVSTIYVIAKALEVHHKELLDFSI